jgi:hypothetical protein
MRKQLYVHTREEKAVSAATLSLEGAPDSFFCAQILLLKEFIKEEHRSVK